MNETPPQSPDIERAVLSACMFECEAIEIAAESLLDGAFYKPANSMIFKAICALFQQGAPVDQLTVTEYLRDNGQLENAGGEAYIAGLSGEITGAANVSHHCRALNEKLRLRKIIAIAQSVKGMCFEPGASSLEISGVIHENIVKLSGMQNDKPYRHVKEYMQEAYTAIVKRAESNAVTGVPTGITRLDWVLDGLQPGDLYILAARPGEGKSALAGQIAVYAAEQNFPVGVFALEMKGRDMGIRFMAAKARQNLSPRAIRENAPNSDEWHRLSMACAAISELPIFIDQTSGLSIAQVFAKANRMKRDFDAKAIIVDYLQLMHGDGGKNETRDREIGQISAGLKGIAKALDVPVLGLSQMSRKSVESEYRRPKLSDLRESGNLEQDADAVIFIYNPSPDDKLKSPYCHENGVPIDDKSGVRTIIVEKNRHGEIGDIDVFWRKEHVTFYNLEYAKRANPNTSAHSCRKR